MHGCRHACQSTEDFLHTMLPAQAALQVSCDAQFLPSKVSGVPQLHAPHHYAGGAGIIWWFFWVRPRRRRRAAQEGTKTAAVIVQETGAGAVPPIQHGRDSASSLPPPRSTYSSAPLPSAANPTRWAVAQTVSRIKPAKGQLAALAGHCLAFALRSSTGSSLTHTPFLWRYVPQLRPHQQRRNAQALGHPQAQAQHSLPHR